MPTGQAIPMIAPDNPANVTPPRQTRPREARSQIAAAGEMTGEWSPKQAVSVRDISQFGLGGEVSEHIPDIGENISILLETGDIIHGQIRWTDGKAFGVRLNDPFHPDKIRKIAEVRERLLEQSRGD
ncbi:MAG: hypothetical protein WBA68_05500 [Alteraurantiacibacter sp.]